MDVEAVILAAGRGERMGELGRRIPKPLLYLPGQYLIDRMLDQLSRAGIARTAVLVGDRRSRVARYVKSSPDIAVLRQHRPPTLCGAIATALAGAADRLLVIHGDNVFSQPFGYFIRAAAGSPAAFLTEAEGSVLAGLYLLSRKLLNSVRDCLACDGLEELKEILISRRVPCATVPLRGWRVNINSPGDYLSAVHRLLDEQQIHSENYAGLPRSSIPSSTTVHEPAWISPGARLARSEIGPYVVVGERAVIEDAILSNAVIYPGSTVRNVPARDVVAVGRRLISLAL
ncbi:hypothetical protein AMJ39_05845 [candidate division TA06 bacterium DG_24]|uniref:MobA-like NTP transferase domain-containing protein n=2 Tax=Bacteria division TA06 TaxID=1156500 RepID=A0A0S7WSE4_UNCT6|nr:MAG: hypothetical protein AMJ39_05845 [candidate division TA06 bacterium DG_24]